LFEDKVILRLNAFCHLAGMTKDCSFFAVYQSGLLDEDHGSSACFGRMILLNEQMGTQNENRHYARLSS